MREDQKKELFSWDFRVFVTGAFHLITWTGVTVRINLEFQKNDKIKQKKNKARGRDWPTQTTTHQLMKKKKIYFSQSQLIIIKAAALKTNKKEIEQLKEEMVPISSCTTPPVKLVKFPKTCTWYENHNVVIIYSI